MEKNKLNEQNPLFFGWGIFLDIDAVKTHRSENGGKKGAL
jgi:hypothetical protein